MLQAHLTNETYIIYIYLYFPTKLNQENTKHCTNELAVIEYLNHTMQAIKDIWNSAWNLHRPAFFFAMFEFRALGFLTIDSSVLF